MLIPLIVAVFLLAAWDIVANGHRIDNWLRRAVVDIPARLFDLGVRAYVLGLLALSIVAIVTAALWLVLGLAGVRLP